MSWKVDLTYTDFEVEFIEVWVNSKTFENGVVQWQVFSGSTYAPCMSVQPGVMNRLNRQQLGSPKEVTLVAQLSGGRGAHGWQHAQLFRTKMADRNIQFKIRIKLQHCPRPPPQMSQHGAWVNPNRKPSHSGKNPSGWDMLGGLVTGVVAAVSQGGAGGGSSLPYPAPYAPTPSAPAGPKHYCSFCNSTGRKGGKQCFFCEGKGGKPEGTYVPRECSFCNGRGQKSGRQCFFCKGTGLER